MGASGTDVVLSNTARTAFPFAVECKNVERLNLWQAWDQAQANQDTNTTPLLVIKKNRTSPLVVLDAEQFFELVKKANG